MHPSNDRLDGSFVVLSALSGGAGSDRAGGGRGGCSLSCAPNIHRFAVSFNSGDIIVDLICSCQCNVQLITFSSRRHCCHQTCCNLSNSVFLDTSIIQYCHFLPQIYKNRCFVILCVCVDLLFNFLAVVAKWVVYFCCTYAIIMSCSCLTTAVN